MLAFTGSLSVASVLLFALPALTCEASSAGNLGAVLKTTHWIAYAPTHYYPGESPPVLPSFEDVLADLTVLRQAGFDGLITYGVDMIRIPEAARRAGFRNVILGIWDPTNKSERENVLRATSEYKKLVVGVIIGNEGLSAGRYSVEHLCAAMAEIRSAIAKPVSTTEPVDWFFGEPRLSECSDFLTVNAHPYFSNRRNPTDAVRWTLDAWQALSQRYPKKPMIFKEVGLPTTGRDGLTEEVQKEYFLRLARTSVIFAYFEAFDATPRFKDGAVEQSWGLWRADRTPKEIVWALPWRASRK